MKDLRLYLYPYGLLAILLLLGGPIGVSQATPDTQASSQEGIKKPAPTSTLFVIGQPGDTGLGWEEKELKVYEEMDGKEEVNEAILEQKYDAELSGQITQPQLQVTDPMAVIKAVQHVNDMNRQQERLRQISQLNRQNQQRRQLDEINRLNRQMQQARNLRQIQQLNRQNQRR